jgi:glutamate formiminotransferase / 5-formyltetrahydrofolate cyclo-ligase
VRLLECIPNISEGKDREKLAEIAEAVRGVGGVRLLDVSSDADHHRSVFTFIGEPSAVKEAALSLARKVLSLIDMRTHRGAHPRLGAVDVVPFVPVEGVTMEEAVEVSKDFGKKLGEEGVPVYFYEESAACPERRELPSIRKGEYEGLGEKLRDPQWRPDEGPLTFDPKWGATVVGARSPLVAYNVNLKTDDLSLAKEIAKSVRWKDGGFPNVRAVGIALKERRRVQVSMNLTNFQVTGIPTVFEFIREQAAEKGVEVEGSEIIGLIPMKALEEVVRYFIKAPDFSSRQVIEKRILEFE